MVYFCLSLFQYLQAFKSEVIAGVSFVHLELDLFGIMEFQQTRLPL